MCASCDDHVHERARCHGAEIDADVRPRRDGHVRIDRSPAVLRPVDDRRMDPRDPVPVELLHRRQPRRVLLYISTCACTPRSRRGSAGWRAPGGIDKAAALHAHVQRRRG